MSAQPPTERPIFASEENEYLTPDRPPVSRLGIVSLLLGLISLIVMFNFDLLAVSVLAITLALATYIFIARNRAVSGQGLALMGLALGVGSGISSYTTTQMRNEYLYQAGKNMALAFVDVLAQSKVLEAYELTRPETERSVAGTSLEEAYKRMPEKERQAIDAFKKQPAVQRVGDLGQTATWRFEKGVSVQRLEGPDIQVVIRLASGDTAQKVDVALSRSYHRGIGAWHVRSIRLP